MRLILYARKSSEGEDRQIQSLDDQTCKVWLKFDDNAGTAATDSSGNGNAGTLTGTAPWTTGNFAGALQLDGSTGYVSVPNLGLTAGTVDMWINPATVSGDQRLFAQLP